MELSTASIDVKKIDKKKLFDGEKGKYLNIVIVPTPNSQYGDFLIKQELTKEEREKGVKAPILGNGKFIKKKESPETVSGESGEDAPF